MENTENKYYIENEVFKMLRTLRGVFVSPFEALDCSLFVLFSAAKHLPLNLDGCVDLDNLNDTERAIYNGLYRQVEKYLRNSRTYLVLFEAYHEFVHEERFAQVYPQALSFLFQFTYEQSGRMAAELWQPAGLSQLIYEILNSYDIRSVYNPFAGTSAILRGLRKDIYYLGQEINEKQILYANIIKDAYECVNVDLIQGDSCHEWKNRRFDAIFANMPWGLKVSEDGFNKESSEAFFLRKASENAVVSVGVYPVGILSRMGADYYLRRELVSRDLIEMIIYLPSKLFVGTSISTCIIVTNKRKSMFGKIQLVDATTFSKKNFSHSNALDVRAILSLLHEQKSTGLVRWITSEEIAKNDFNLSLNKYVGKEIDIPEGYQLYKMRDLCTILHNKTQEPGVGRVVRMKDLANNVIDINRTVTDFPIEEYSRGCDIIQQDALLLGTVQRLKPTYFYSGGETICLKSNVIALDVNKDIVSIPYLVGELNKDYVKDQIYVEGGTVPHIPIREILNLKILVPSLAQQEAEVSARIRSLETEKERALAEEAAAFKAEVHNRKHDIMTYMQNFMEGLGLLDIYAKRINDENLAADIADTATAMRYDYRMMYEQLEHFADDDEFGVEAKMDLVAALRKQVGMFGNYSVQLDIDEAYIPKNTKAWVSIASVDFNRLLSNIIGNAKQHGFTDPLRKDYEIMIKLYADLKKDVYIIDFCNNGNPIPATMDKFKYGIDGEKAGENAGSGKGGSRVKKICQHYHGDYDLGKMSERGQEWQYIRIILPIQQGR